MAGIGIGPSIALGGGGLSETGVARAIAAKGLSDANARAAIGGAASLAAGLRTVGLLPALPTPTPTPAPAVTPLPSGIAAMWDAASLSALANGAAVTSWTDGIGGSVAAQTSDSTASMTFVADSGNSLPAVRLTGASTLATSGTNAAATAMSGSTRTLIVVARRILAVSPSYFTPALAASGDASPYLMLLGSDTMTGTYGLQVPATPAGIRTIAYAIDDNLGSAIPDFGVPGQGIVGINGTAIGAQRLPAGGQVYIGGWLNTSTNCCGRADILAVIVWPRMLSAAELKQVHRHYCDLSGQVRPGGAAARHVSFIGDSLSAGYQPEPKTTLDYLLASYPYQMAQGLGWEWGTWDQLAYTGDTWPKMQGRSLPSLGNVSAATGTKNIVCGFEFANMRSQTPSYVSGQAQAMIDALHAQDGNREVIFGTSTDDASAGGQQYAQHRIDYNALQDAAGTRVTGIAAYVPLHLDANIGVAGVAPSDGNGNTWYQVDGEHFKPAGSALIDNGPHGFRAAVLARLAA